MSGAPQQRCSLAGGGVWGGVVGWVPRRAPPRRGVGAPRSRAAGQAGVRGRRRRSRSALALPVLRGGEEGERCRSGLRGVCQGSNFGAPGVSAKVPSRCLAEVPSNPNRPAKRGLPCPTPQPWRAGVAIWKTAMWPQRRATSHMAFGVAVRLVAGFVGSRGVWRPTEEGACQGVAASVRGVAPGGEFGPVHRSLKAGNVKGYFATYLRASWGSREATHSAGCLPSAATKREEPCRAPCGRAAGEGSARLCPCCWERVKLKYQELTVATLDASAL